MANNINNGSSYGYDPKRNVFFILNTRVGVENLPCSGEERALLMSQYVSESMRTIEEGLRAISRAQDPNHVYSSLEDAVRSLGEKSKSYVGILNPAEDQKINGE